MDVVPSYFADFKHVFICWEDYNRPVFGQINCFEKTVRFLDWSRSFIRFGAAISLNREIGMKLKNRLTIQCMVRHTKTKRL